ncbi:MAG: NAD-dependent epimerase/dehydratase family protein [Hyphomicrobiales bacterium]|nr:NAD-dependent epimerase/dehydratase family protein [Hyphomicrobiales bacterium]
MADKKLRAGIVGAGYIAAWHADAIRATRGVEVAAVCDVSQTAAEDLASGLGVPGYTSLQALIDARLCDAVHILTPPQFHRDLTVQALEGGLHAFVEKPFALSRSECAAMNEAAERSGRHVAVSHNFLGVPSYVKLKSAIEAGTLGRIAAAEFNWRFPLAPLRSGPFNLWLLREPENLLLELGPHLYAFAVDLFGTPEDFHLVLGQPIELSGGGRRHQSWRIFARAGSVDLTFNLSLVETFDDRSVAIYGSSGMAKLDYANDTLLIDRESAAEIVVNPLLRQMSGAGQHLREGLGNAVRQAVSLNRKSPYGLSFQGVVKAFYEAVRGNAPLDERISGKSAEAVIGAIEDTLALLPAGSDEPVNEFSAPAVRTSKPSVLVIGGTGFIGRDLTRKLVASGRDVRVLSRGSTGPFADIVDHVETVSVSLHDREGLSRAMDGMDAVFNLAKSLDKTWEGCLKNDVGVAERVAEAAMDAGVRRLVYTGTIASYDMSEPETIITERTGFAEDMTDRNLYARSKAVCEARLTEMHRDRELPLVIARPGIVVGEGGPLQHWGIGRWQGAGAVRIWGHGRNILPFAWIDDVSDGLIRMIETDDAVGQSFNLVGDPMMSARDYFDAIHERLGARIKVKPGSLMGFYLADGVKYALKRHVLGKKNAVRASLRDWKSRAHFSPFRNEHPKSVLGWRPEGDREVFIQKAIVDANLFGF